MKILISKRKNGTSRHSIDFSDAKDLTDQSFKKSCDINNIMKSYEKTGLLPEVNKALARYVDNTTAIPLELAYERINEAKALFHELPLAIRKQMDNDPTQLEAFLSNPDNHDQLLKHGLLTKADENNEVIPPQPSADIPEPKKD